jgi:hypothetical protein
LTFVHGLKQKRKKLDYKATPDIVVRYIISTKQYFVHDTLARTLHHSRHVVLREGKGYAASNTADKVFLNWHFYRAVVEEPKPTPTKKDSETTQPVYKQPTEFQMQKPLDYTPPDPLKPQ